MRAVTDELGFSALAPRRDLTALRHDLGTVTVGTHIAAVFRTADHGRFSVEGRVRHDLTESVLKVGWCDLTSGKGSEPAADLQQITPVADSTADDDTDAPDALAVVVATLARGDVVTAGFDFEGCGRFTISGAVRQDALGTSWLVAGHIVAHGHIPAPRLRTLAAARNTATS